MWVKVQHAYTRNIQAETQSQTNTVHSPTPRPPVGAVMTNWCTNMLLQVHQAGRYGSIPSTAPNIMGYGILRSLPVIYKIKKYTPQQMVKSVFVWWVFIGTFFSRQERFLQIKVHLDVHILETWKKGNALSSMAHYFQFSL